MKIKIMLIEKIFKKTINGLFILISCLFFYGCGSIGPSVPNESYSGTYPPGFEIIQNENQLLFREIGKLPEILDGITETDQIALKRLVILYQNNRNGFDTTFDKMYRVGLPDVRKYCTPLQALYWLSMNKENEELRTYITHYSLRELLYQAWLSIDGERWDDFDTVIARLNAPQLLDYYERRVFHYKYRQGYGEGPEEARRVFKNKYGHCAQITAFTKYALQRAGYKTGRRIIVHPAGRSYKGNDHRACEFEVNGKNYIMDNGRYPPFGIVRVEDYTFLTHPYRYNYYKLWDKLSED